MPVIPPTPVSGVYDPVFFILNETKSRVGEQMPSLQPYTGNILDATQASTQQRMNNAWRNFQDSLCDAGSKKFQQSVVIEGIPPTHNYDPAVQSSISWFQCFDGDNYQLNPVLPSDLVTPLWMSERQSGTQDPFPGPDEPNMDFYIDGLPMYGQKYCRNGCWEWRGEVIYYPGATQAVDFMIRYRKNLPDFVDVGSQRWFTQPVQMVRCQDPLSWWLVVEVATAASAIAGAPGNALQLAQSARLAAVEATKKYANRDVMLDQRTEAQRIPYNGGSRGQGVRYGSGGGYGW